MQDNPVHKTLGVGDYYSIAGTTVNFRWLRYIYLAKRILDSQILNKDNVWVDIGSYYGGLQGLIKKYNPRLKIVMVDFHHQLCRSFIYLYNIYPNAIHIMPDEINKFESFDSLPEGSIAYVPAGKFSQISFNNADLVTNFFSFGEMTHKVFDSYYNSELFNKSKRLFLVNRFVSAPFFEGTYNTNLNILNYIKNERNIDYFDVFPMHHYMLHERNLFNRFGFRNASSSYFEYFSSLR
jgi:putative sugar O-methyltransferase